MAATTRARREPTGTRTHDIASPAMQSSGVRQTARSPPRERGRKRPFCRPTSPDKLEKCRTQAQQRRMTQKGLMDELAGLLPFPREVTSQMDTKTVLRLAVCYLRVKSLLAEEGASSPSSSASDSSSTHLASVEGWPLVPTMVDSSSPYHLRDGGGHQSLMAWNPASRLIGNGMGPWLSDSSLATGIFKDLMVEALQGFLMVVSCDGTVLYLSESVFTHTGLFQSEHTGRSMYSLIHEEDHGEVRDSITAAEAAALSSGVVPCSFFCRLKSKKKNSHLKAPGYKLAYVSGHCKVHQLEPYVACMVHIVSAPSILEIQVEGNAFTTRHDLNMKIIFYDERMRDVLGYSKKDLIGQSLFTLHHHDDLAVTEKCSHKVREKGEAVTGYYRILTRYGTYVWLQTRGTMVMDRRTGKPSQLICMHFLVDKDKGDNSLKLRNLLAEDTSSHRPIAMDPLPVPRPDGKSVNPLPTSAVNSFPTSAINPFSLAVVNPLPTSTLNSFPTSTLNPLPTSTVNSFSTSTFNPLPTSTVNSFPTSTINPLPTSTVNPLPTSTLNPLPTSTVNSFSTSTFNPLPTSTVNSFPTSTVNPLPTSTVNPLPTTADFKLGALSPPSTVPPSHSPLSSSPSSLSTSPPDSAHDHAPIPPCNGQSTVWCQLPPSSSYPTPSLTEFDNTVVGTHSVIAPVQSAMPPQMKPMNQFPCSQTSRLPLPGSQTHMPPFLTRPQSIPSGPVLSQPQLFPLSRSSSHSSSSLAATFRDSSSTVPTPFSTPVPSPYWHNETSPTPSSGPYSNPNSIASSSSNPRSIPSSGVNSPQPVPGSTNPDPSSLEAILQDLMGDGPQSQSSSLPQGAVPVSISISPDNGYTELETCLATSLGSSHHSPHYSSSAGTTPAHSPAGVGYYSNPTPAAEVGCYSNPIPSQSPNWVGCYSNPSGAPSPQVSCTSSVSPPIWGAEPVPVNPFFTTFSTSPPQYPVVHPPTTSMSGYQLPASSVATGTNSGTLRGLLSSPDLHGTLLF